MLDKAEGGEVNVLNLKNTERAFWAPPWEEQEINTK